jgi:hypothetical protein
VDEGKFLIGLPAKQEFPDIYSYSRQDKADDFIVRSSDNFGTRNGTTTYELLLLLLL